MLTFFKVYWDSFSLFLFWLELFIKFSTSYLLSSASGKGYKFKIGFSNSDFIGHWLLILFTEPPAE